MTSFEPNIEGARIVGAACAALFLVAPLAAQCPNDWQPLPLTTLNHSVLDTLVFDDGNGEALFIGGTLASPQGIGRWDGERFVSVGGGVQPDPVQGGDPTVAALAVFDAGDGGGPQLYVGGEFLRANGVTVRSLARWNGSTWSNIGGNLQDSGWTAFVFALAAYDSGTGPELYAAGQFDSSSIGPVANIIRWDGTTWHTVGSGLAGTCRALEVYDDGSGPALYATGYFQSAGGQPASRIARWDGTNWSALGTGLGAEGNALTVFDPGTGPGLYIGGAFLTAGGIAASRLARWDGTWSDVGGGVAGTVLSLGVHDEGTGDALYVGGSFLNAGTGGIPANQIARWSGAQWSALGAGLSQPARCFTDWSPCSAVQAQLLVGGGFDSADGSGVSRLALWDSASFSAFGGDEGIAGAVRAALVWDDGSGGGPALFAAGDFSRAGTISAARIARRDKHGWTALGSGLNGIVHALAVWDDGGGEALYAGGEFTTAGGLAAPGVARWNGTTWSAAGPSMPGSLIYALHVHDDGQGGGPMLYAGGRNDSAGMLHRFNGSTWTNFGGGVNGFSDSQRGVRALATFAPQGQPAALYIGGTFSVAGGQSISHLARWNGVSFSAPHPSPPAGRIYAMHSWTAPGDVPQLYFGGSFTHIGPIQAQGVARWNGSLWLPLDLGVSLALTFHPWDDGAGEKLYVGGNFTVAGQTPASEIAAWDGSAWSALGAGVQHQIYAIAPYDDGDGEKLYVGGILAEAGGRASSGIAAWGKDCAFETYCTGAPNSAGAGASISASGSASVCANDLVLHVSGAISAQFGMFYYGPNQVQAPFGDGFRCVGAGGLGTFRLLPPLPASGTGTAQHALDLSAPPASAGQILPGSSWNFQYWYRDPAFGGTGFNLSDALKVEFEA